MIIYKKIFDNIKNRSYNNHNNNLFIKIYEKKSRLIKKHRELEFGEIHPLNKFENHFSFAYLNYSKICRHGWRYQNPALFDA